MFVAADIDEAREGRPMRPARVIVVLADLVEDFRWRVRPWFPPFFGHES